ncbi:unnamed protein product [Rotaria magnacalcarata]|uniref:Uncharacterized protein n=1 Tax=Rotaria magnacalcarata TaxID=392030 RepID=A0A8S3DAN2_9BILA|nr:unnamed protein product [Rotaria magnacalcarata]
MGRSTVTPEKKIEIKTLLKMGLIQRQVVPGVKIGQGRKKASTSLDDRDSAEWTLSNDKRLCGSTGRRRLISMGHKSYTVRLKPLRKFAQIKQRLTVVKDRE